MTRKQSTGILTTISALTARTQLGQIMELAQRERARFVVSRNGRPAVVIMAIEDFLENRLASPEALAALQTAARRRRLDLLSMEDIDAEVAGVRGKKRQARPA